MSQVEATNVAEKAHVAWADQAERESRSAERAIRSKMRRALFILDTELEVSPDMFDGEVSPWLRIGVERDGLTFCFTEGRRLAVVSWRCAKKDCDAIIRTPFIDYPSLGKALAENGCARQDKCGRH